MLLLAAYAAATLTTTSATPERPLATRQARATVTILSAPALRFEEIEAKSPERFRDTVVRDAEGAPRPARLVEFQ